MTTEPVAERTVLVPDETHPITIEVSTDVVTVRVDGRVVAESRRALALREASYPVAYYLPREDVEDGALQPSDHRTYCPYKGDCRYFDLVTEEGVRTNAVWSYEKPYAAVAEIAGHVAFY